MAGSTESNGMRNWKIGTRIAAGLAPGIVITLVLGILSYRDQKASLDAAIRDCRAANSRLLARHEKDLISNGVGRDLLAGLKAARSAFSNPGEEVLRRNRMSRPDTQKRAIEITKYVALHQDLAAEVSRSMEGAGIELETKSGSTDLRDRDFAPYQV
jgi:hypothetical protein